MKKIIITISILVCFCFQTFSQVFESPIFSFSLTKEFRPANLNFVEKSIKLNNPNNIIDANESFSITAEVKNDGAGDATGCSAQLTAIGDTKDINFDNSKRIAIIKRGETKLIKFDINTGRNTLDGSVKFILKVDEPNGFGTEPIELNVATAKFSSPFVKIVDYKASSNIIYKKIPFDIQLMLQNIKPGRAEDVKVEIEVPDGVFMTEGEKFINISSLNGGENKALNYSFIVNKNYSNEKIPIKFNIKEKYGEFAENYDLNLNIGEGNKTAIVDYTPIYEEKVEPQEITIASLHSDVDQNIPKSSSSNNNTYAVIIANENYQDVESVPYALNDGEIFYKYCKSTLGIPEKNISLNRDVTFGRMKQIFNWVDELSKVCNSESRIILYYAGHGIPNESNKSAYLLPTDGFVSDCSSAYSLDKLYSDFSKYKFKSITFFLDACFSGSKREDGMLAKARGVAIKVNKARPHGNMVVFSAAQGDETAYPYKEKKHGMFTYYLLKKLQETEGKVSYFDLGEYIKSNVARESVLINKKSQTPSISASDALGKDWYKWELK